jgi:nicotinamide-nucleotide amidase
MANNIKELFGTDYSIAISGTAGPTGGTPDKPVGTTWIAIGTPDHCIAYKFNLGTDRIRNIHMASLVSLNLLRKNILKAGTVKV